MSDVAIPTSIEITEEAIEAEAAEPQFREGAAVVFALNNPRVKMEETRNGDPKVTGHDIVVTAQAVLLDPEDQSTRLTGMPYAGTWNVLPLPTGADHAPPDWAKSMWAQMCSALLPGADIVGHYPPQGPFEKGGRWYYDGEEINPADVGSIKRGRAKQRLDFANKVLESRGAVLERLMAYGTFKRNKKNGRMGLANLSCEPPKDGLTSVDDLLIQVSADGDKTKAAKNNGRRPSAGGRRKKKS